MNKCEAIRESHYKIKGKLYCPKWVFFITAQDARDICATCDYQRESYPQHEPKMRTK